MKIWLGDEMDLSFRDKIKWIKQNFREDQYKIIETGFLINEYFVEFVDDMYETLYYVQYPE
jgi:hypothetical protein